MMHQSKFVATDNSNRKVGMGCYAGDTIEVTLDSLMSLSELRLSPLVPTDPLMAESLTCNECGNDGPDTLAEAIAEGWKSIEHRPDGLSWNFLGTCPCCPQEGSIKS